MFFLLVFLLVFSNFFVLERHKIFQDHSESFEKHPALFKGLKNKAGFSSFFNSPWLPSVTHPVTPPDFLQ